MRLEKIANTQVLYEKNNSKIINIQILTDIGSSDEHKNEYGVAHFLEHMFFKGTPTRDAKRINRDADLIGAKLNAWTGHDHTNYHITVLQENFEKGFELLSDIYLNATFPADELEKERTVILSEMRRYDDDPGSYLSDRAVEDFCENGLAHKVIGTEISVKNLTRETLIQFKNRFYGGDNVLISIVGDVEWESVKHIVTQYFKNHSCEYPCHLATTQYRQGFLELKKAEIQEAQYQLLYPALPHNHPKAVAQNVMSFVLGGNASALLFERIREELGLCYGVYSRVYHFEAFNFVEISTGCSEKDLGTLHTEVVQIVDRFKRTKIDEERLEMVKAALLSSFYMGLESSAGLNNFLILSYLRGETGDFVQNRIREIKAVTREDILQLAEETFSVAPFHAQLIAEKA
jgi:predicted Zn-dependent peptidase